MNPETHISSLQNPLIKQTVRLQQKSSERRKTGLFVVEGRREVSLACAHDIESEQILICDELYRADPTYPIPNNHIRKKTIVTKAVYNKIAYREDAEGVLMIGKQKLLDFDDLKLPENPLILVLEGIEKPGNLGAIFRTADAAGVDALLLAGPRTDIYNPNAIRASLGCVFSVPAVSAQSHDLISRIKDPAKWPGEKQPMIYAAALQNAKEYYDSDLNGPTVLVFGSEDKGLTQPWREAADQIIKIPMAGSIDSLNLAASVAILCFEARKQRDCR